MAMSLEQLQQQVDAFVTAANSGLVSVNPEAGERIAGILARMADRVESMQTSTRTLAIVPPLGGHPECILMRERQSLVASGDEQSFEHFLGGLHTQLLSAKGAVEASMRLIRETDESAADGLGRQYE